VIKFDLISSRRLAHSIIRRETKTDQRDRRWHAYPPRTQTTNTCDAFVSPADHRPSADFAPPPGTVQGSTGTPV